MTELKVLIDAIRSGDRVAINEASLGRVYQHILADGSNSFAILTAFRGGFSKKENLARNKALQVKVRNLGLGFFKVRGYWLECQDPSVDYKDCPDDQKVPVVEESLFIPNISFKDAVRLAQDYKQDGFIYQGSDTKNKVCLINKSGKILSTLGKFSPNKIAQAYTQIKGKSFVFEGFEYTPNGQLESLAFEAIMKSKDSQGS